LPDLSWVQHTKTGKNIPNNRKTDQMALKYTPTSSFVFFYFGFENMPSGNTALESKDQLGN
jgi:hypothetical protein